MKDEEMPVEFAEMEVEVEPKEEEPTEDSSGYETPEEAMEKALAESSVEDAIERLRHCGYELTKLEGTDASVDAINPQKKAASRRMAVAEKAMNKFGLK